MKELRSALILLLLLGFGVSQAVRAEDAPETPYDESAALPYEGTPVFSFVRATGSSGTTLAMPIYLRHKVGAPSPFTSARVRDTDANRSANSQSLLALLCALLC
jgi:hypothetical protein